MREGYWVNYDNDKTFDVEEHEQFIREPKNAKAMGVPANVIKDFKKFTPVKDRDKFLLYVMKHAPLMRVRGHGNAITFEYATRSRRPMDAIWTWAKENAGPFTFIQIYNLETGENAGMNFQTFEETMGSGGAEAVMRVAKALPVRRQVAKALLRIAKAVVA